MGLGVKTFSRPSWSSHLITGLHTHCRAFLLHYRCMLSLCINDTGTLSFCVLLTPPYLPNRHSSNRTMFLRSPVSTSKRMWKRSTGSGSRWPMRTTSLPISPCRAHPPCSFVCCGRCCWRLTKLTKSASSELPPLCATILRLEAQRWPGLVRKLPVILLFPVKLRSAQQQKISDVGLNNLNQIKQITVWKRPQ